MSKVKRGFEIVFVFAAVLGLLTAVFFITTSQQTNAQGYPYPEPTVQPCGRIDDPIIGPYPEACVYLPGVLSESEDEAAAAPTIIPSVPRLPISAPNTP